MSVVKRSGGRLSHRIGISDMEVILAISRDGSMAKAARALAISQPAVSRAVAELEATLGVRLLDRNPRGVALTSYGEALARRAALVLDEMTQCMKEIDFLSDPTTGELYIGSPEPLTEALLPEVIQNFWRKYPRVLIHVIPSRSGEFGDLRHRKIDFMLGRTPEDYSAPDIDKDVLFHEEQFVVTGLRSPWVRRRNIRLADLAHEKWVVTSAAFEPMPRAFAVLGLPVPRPSIAAHSAFLRNTLVASGEFLAVLSSPQLIALRNQNLKVKILPIDMSKFENEIAVFKLKNRTLSPVAKLFIEHAQDAYQRGNFGKAMRKLYR
jgi:DNA-binding transcriptional LysR family regulator